MIDRNGQELERPEAEAILRTANPQAGAAMISQYVSVFFEYWEAETNIRKNGTVCAHPRTGAPLENPYVKVKAGALRNFATLKTPLRTDALWQRMT